MFGFRVDQVIPLRGMDFLSGSDATAEKWRVVPTPEMDAAGGETAKSAMIGWVGPPKKPRFGLVTPRRDKPSSEALVTLR